MTDVWRIACRPEGRYEPASGDEDAESVNRGGMIVYLVHASSRQEIARVGFVRRNTMNPDAEFADKLREVVDTAREAAKMIAELTTTQEGLQ
jgi:hypothetical protein